MRLTFRREEDIQAALHAEYLAGERAVTAAMDRAARQIKQDWRGQITRAGLGRRLANTIRARRFPEREASMDAAALVWSKAPEIVGAHARGALIRSREGFWLAIPLPTAGRGRGGARLTPGEWERRRGMRLRFVYRRGGPSLLVADSARVSRRGVAVAKRGRRRKTDGILTGEQTVPVFLLVPQVRLPRRLDLVSGAKRVQAAVPVLIVAGWSGDRA
jgi:hypothetical protein